jgi:transcriptional regulator with XRE-family HTH domain
MVLGIPSQRSYHVRHNTKEDLVTELEHAISFLKQNMTDRKESLKTSDQTVGESVKKLRQRAGLAVGDIAASVGTSSDAMTRIEESPDYLANPSLLMLRKLAQSLGVKLSDIADPDYMRLVARETLQLIQDGSVRVEARQGKGSIPIEDQLSIIVIALQERLAKKKI